MIPQRNNLNHIMRNGILAVREMLKQTDHRLEGMENYLKNLAIGHTGEKIERIILHHSLTKDNQTVSWNAIRRYHTQELHWADIGYHFGIELVGDHYEVLVGRPMTEEGAHCKEYGMNRKSLGICFVGNFDIQEPPKEQWDLGVKLVKSLMAVLAIPKGSLSGHREYAPYKSCPGKRFDMGQFRREVKNA